MNLQKLHNVLTSIPHAPDPKQLERDTTFNEVWRSAERRRRFLIETYYQERYGVNTIEEAVQKIMTESSDKNLTYERTYDECHDRYCKEIDVLPEFAPATAFIAAHYFFSDCYIRLMDKELRDSTDQLFAAMIFDAAERYTLFGDTAQEEAMLKDIDPERLFAHFMKIIDNADGPVILPAITDLLEFYRNRT